MSTLVNSHLVTRIEIETEQDYDLFRLRYTNAVPQLDRDKLARFVAAKTPWSDVVGDAARNAPLDFYIFWSMDTTGTMQLAGDTGRCTEYLMGNHTIAEQMYRRDPIAMLYVPLRTLIYAKDGGKTTFVVEQPSSTLGSLRDDTINDVALALDVKLARLFEHLAIDVPRELRTP